MPIHIAICSLGTYNMATSRQNPEVSHLLSSYNRCIYESVLTQSWRNLVFLQRLKWDLKWLNLWGFADGIARFNWINKCTKSFLSISSCDLNPKSLYKLCDKTPHPSAPISSSQGQISSWIQKGRRTWTSSPLPFPPQCALRGWRQLRKHNDWAKRTT